MTLTVTAEDVRRLLPLDDCIAAVEEAFRQHGMEDRQSCLSGLLSAHAERGTFHIKTAFVGQYFGAKANANFPSNPQDRGLPAIQGVMLLFDANDGRPLMIADSIDLTALRTAAATAVAAKYLARKDAMTATIVGCGRQGRVQLEALRRVIPLKRVYAFDADHQRAREMDAVAVTTLESRDTDIWITCTPSPVPFLRPEHVRKGAFVAAVGADNPSKSEITPELMAASRIVTDVTDQCIEIGDLHHAIAAGVVSRNDVVAELGEVVAGRRTARRSDDDIVIFDSTGTGFQDTAAAAVIYERARP